jgi:hypothetical protein
MADNLPNDRVADPSGKPGDSYRGEKPFSILRTEIMLSMTVNKVYDVNFVYTTITHYFPVTIMKSGNRM